MRSLKSQKLQQISFVFDSEVCVGNSDLSFHCISFRGKLFTCTQPGRYILIKNYKIMKILCTTEKIEKEIEQIYV